MEESPRDKLLDGLIKAFKKNENEIYAVAPTFAADVNKLIRTYKLEELARLNEELANVQREMESQIASMKIDRTRCEHCKWK